MSSSKSHSLELMEGRPSEDLPGWGFRVAAGCDDVTVLLSWDGVA